MPVDPHVLASRSLHQLISLEGRRAVITGGARGLGYAIATRFAEAGADIVLGDKNESGATDAAEALSRQFGRKISSALLDVTDSTIVAEFAREAERRLGGIDIWVNNAGAFPSASLIETTDEQWDFVHNVNLRGTFLGCREAGRRMAAAGHGVIINITSVSGYRGRASISHYAAAKHGVAGLTKSLAMELGPKGVRVVAVSPAMTETPGLQEQRAASDQTATQDFRELERKILATFPLGRFGQPDDVARVVLFAASDLAAFVTATTVFCDGGVSAF